MQISLSDLNVDNFIMKHDDIAIQKQEETYVNGEIKLTYKKRKNLIKLGVFR